MSLIEERARVLRVEHGAAWVHCESQAGCQRCAEGRGCGGGVFARLLRRRLEEMPVENSIDAMSGDAVLVGVEPVAVQNAAFVMYGLPLAGLLLGALAGQGEAAAIAGAGIGLIIGLLLARLISRRLGNDPRYRPVLLRKLRADEPCPASLESPRNTDE